MGKNTGIAWCDHTFNPWWGCEKVSSGCKNCYAETLAGRYAQALFGTDRLWRGERRRTKRPWNDVKRWDREAALDGVRKRVFCASMADFFEDHPSLPEWRSEAWELILSCQYLDFLLLTKRPENIREMLPPRWDEWSNGWPNVWLGVTVESGEFETRVYTLCNIPAVVRFVSYEPAVGPLSNAAGVWLGRDGSGAGIDWLIYGGESGPRRREDLPEWGSSAMEHCRGSGASFFYKQSAGLLPGTVRPGVFPLVRQFPTPKETDVAW